VILLCCLEADWLRADTDTQLRPPALGLKYSELSACPAENVLQLPDAALDQQGSASAHRLFCGGVRFSGIALRADSDTGF